MTQFVRTNEPTSVHVGNLRYLVVEVKRTASTLSRNSGWTFIHSPNRAPGSSRDPCRLQVGFPGLRSRMYAVATVGSRTMERRPCASRTRAPGSLDPAHVAEGRHGSACRGAVVVDGEWGTAERPNANGPPLVPPDALHGDAEPVQAL